MQVRNSARSLIFPRWLQLVNIKPHECLSLVSSCHDHAIGEKAGIKRPVDHVTAFRHE